MSNQPLNNYADPNMTALMLDPYSHFSAPLQVAESTKLNPNQKLSILKSMAHDARELQVASEENISGPPSAFDLEDIHAAIRLVDPGRAPSINRSPSPAKGN